MNKYDSEDEIPQSNLSNNPMNHSDN